MLAALATALCFIVVAFLAAALPAAWMRKRHGAQQPPETRELGREIITRVGLLHGLILGLVFGQVISNVGELRAGLRAEAASLEHVYFRAGELPAPAVQAAALAYAKTVVERDWPRQEHAGKLSDEGWYAWRRLLEASLALDPQTRRERLLADSIQAEVLTIERQRQLRAYQATPRLPLEFWFASIAGLALIGMVLFVHEATPKHQAIVSAYSIYAGIVLYMIFDISQPYSGLLTTGPDDFVQALEAFGSKP